MDYCTVTGYWEEEVDGIDNSSSCCLLWTVIPLPGQVSVQIECFKTMLDFLLHCRLGYIVATYIIHSFKHPPCKCE